MLQGCCLRLDKSVFLQMHKCHIYMCRKHQSAVEANYKLVSLIFPWSNWSFDELTIQSQLFWFSIHLILTCFFLQEYFEVSDLCEQYCFSSKHYRPIESCKSNITLVVFFPFYLTTTLAITSICIIFRESRPLTTLRNTLF